MKKVDVAAEQTEPNRQMINSRTLIGICLAAALALFSAEQGAGAGRERASASSFQGDVYILSGGFGLFSTGLSDLRTQLAGSGIAASQASYQSWRSIAKKIADHRQNHGRKPVVIIGHSLGANSAIMIANYLKSKGIQVDLIVTYAATAPLTVPSNVRNVLNFYFKSGGWGAVLKGDRDFGGSLENEDLSGNSGIGHFNVDDSQALRDRVVRKVLVYVKPQKRAGPAPK